MIRTNPSVSYEQYRNLVQMTTRQRRRLYNLYSTKEAVLRNGEEAEVFLTVGKDGKDYYYAQGKRVPKQKARNLVLDVVTNKEIARLRREASFLIL